MLHTLLNTFVWGLTPASREEKKRWLSKRASVAQHLAVSEDYSVKTKDEDNFFQIFGRKISGVDLNWMSLVPNFPDLEVPAHDLILHDPKFWQAPKMWWNFFKARNRIAFSSYISTMTWKLRSLVKLTFGLWSESQLEQFQIRYRAG